MAKDIQMMDAGSALFEMKGGFGTAMGQIKAEMSEFGKVTTNDDEMVLEFSGLWRHARISCQVEDASVSRKADDGEEIRMYAAVFKEGSRNTRFRTMVHSLAVLALIASQVIIRLAWPGLSNFVLSTFTIVVILTLLYNLTIPGKRSVQVTKKLKAKISGLKA